MMGRFIDLTGIVAGRLTVNSMHGRSSSGRITWLCSCECGARLVVDGSAIRSGNTKSCGCLKRDSIVSWSTKHGRTNTRVFMVWEQMIARCHSPSHKNYPDYGGRGITVCEEWRSSFSAFLSDMGEPEAGLSIERINNSLGYNKRNCRWATRIDQMNNMRNNVILKTTDRIFTMAEFARLIGFAYYRVRSAVRRGVRVLGGVEFEVFRRRDMMNGEY